MTVGKVWLITGTSSGFGWHLVKCILNRSSEDRVIATARTISKIQDLESERCRLLQLDVTDGFDILNRKAEEAIDIWGRVDVLVNNAGIGGPEITEEAGYDGYMRHFLPNVFGVVNVTNAFLPYMRERREGTILIVGSRSSWTSHLPMIAPYASSKAAVHGIGEGLAKEVAQFNIRVLIVVPGGFRTEITAPHRLPEHIPANPIPDYDKVKKQAFDHYENIVGAPPGDPHKAMEVVVDVVRGEGKAAGKKWPLWLFLGQDAEVDIRNRCAQVVATLDEWKEVTRSTDVEEEN